MQHCHAVTGPFETFGCNPFALGLYLGRLTDGKGAVMPSHMVKAPARRKPRTFPKGGNAKAVEQRAQGYHGALAHSLRKTR
jgi:hypothetical protein